jgi:hypothetical protein
MTWNGAPFWLTVPDTSPFLCTPRFTLIGVPPVVRLPDMCTLVARRTDACIAVTSAVEVGPGGAVLGALPIGALPIGGELLDVALPPQPAITTAAQPATVAINTLAGTPMAS